MDVEREVVDLYRALLMRDHIGDTCEGTITALVGIGALPFRFWTHLCSSMS